MTANLTPSSARPSAARSGVPGARRGAVVGGIAAAVLSVFFNGIDPLILVCFAGVGATCGSLMWGVIALERTGGASAAGEPPSPQASGHRRHTSAAMREDRNAEAP
jgi:hypothetical protein